VSRILSTTAIGSVYKYVILKRNNPSSSIMHGELSLEVVSKRQIAFESKAQADEKAQHTCEYVSILKRSATQLSDARWCFETTSNADGE
jgi:hypothetical protein